MMKKPLTDHVWTNATFLVEEILNGQPHLYENIINLLDYSEGALCDFLAENDIEWIGLDYEEMLETAYELGYNAEIHEIFEWYIVSDYLYGLLKFEEEPVFKHHGVCFWGRTSYGQTISFDPFFQKYSKNV